MAIDKEQLQRKLAAFYRPCLDCNGREMPKSTKRQVLADMAYHLALTLNDIGNDWTAQHSFRQIDYYLVFEQNGIIWC